MTRHCSADSEASKKGSDPNSAKHPTGRSGYWGRTPFSALALLSCCIIASLIVPLPIHGRASIALGDLVHAPLFGSITLVVLLLLRRRFDRRIPAWGVLMVAGFVCAFGVVIELIQSVSGRTPNIHDVFSNTAGIITAVAVYYAYSLHRSTPRTSLALLLAGSVVMAIAWRPPLAALFDVAKARLEFPVLASFESDAEFHRFHFHQCKPLLTRKNATSGRFAMEITYAVKDYPDARLQEFNPDWSDVDALELDLILDQSYPQAKLEFLIEVVDQPRGRNKAEPYRQSIELEPGVQRHIRISRQQLLSGPQDHELNLSAIVAIDLIAVKPQVAAKVRVDSIELTISGTKTVASSK